MLKEAHVRHIRTALALGAIGSAAFATPAFAQASPPPCTNGTYAPCPPGQGEGTPPGQGGGTPPGQGGQIPGQGGGNVGRPGRAEQSRQGTASDDTPNPGQTIRVSGPANVFKPGTPVTVGIVRGSSMPDALNGRRLGGGNSASDGGYGQDVTIPTDAQQDAVYYLYMTGVDANDQPILVIIPVSIPISGSSASAAFTANRSAGGTTSGRAASAQSPSADSGSGSQSAPAVMEIPVAVAALRLEAPVESAIVDAVSHQDAVLRIEDGQLIAASQDGDDTRPLVAALAIGLAGGGIVLLRRRSSLNPGVAR